MSRCMIAGIITWGALIIAFIFSLPSARIHGITVKKPPFRYKIIAYLMLFVTIVGCTWPMKLSPIWNGDIPAHRNQYERMAEAILDGHLYMEYEVDSHLLEMENPYDRHMRKEMGASYQWDHAFYKGRYYMYFGVVPVFLVFLPWRILTGQNLRTYHATQLFVALFIYGVFMLFKKIADVFFENLPFSIWVFSSMAFSVISIWYSIAAPALYCTAITSGLCMEIWSLYFFFQAVWDKHDEGNATSAFLGSLFGALAFGCRPPIALANILAFPLLCAFFFKSAKNRKLFPRLLCAVLPYLIVAFLLMLYNYARFENPFEFGQSYQLTEADQSQYIHMFSRWNWAVIVNGFHYFLTSLSGDKGPLSLGAFVTFPILLYIMIGIVNPETRKRIKAQNAHILLSVMLLVPILIIIIDVLWTPFLMPRSRMDVYWILGVLDYIIIGFYYQSKRKKAWLCFRISLLSVAAIVVCIALYLYPNDKNFTEWYGYGEHLMKRILTLGIR